MDSILRFAKKLIPRSLFGAVAPTYHYLLALLAALAYRFPGHSITVVMVTGTKGKSSTLEFLNAMLEADGKRTALASTIRHKIGEKSEKNMSKMTIQGRFFLQRFLREAVDGGCSVALIEMTSAGAKQFRHKWIDLDALIVTNVSPEHIEDHGSYENYLAAKISIAEALEQSKKKDRVLVVNALDKEHEAFEHAAPHARAIPFSLDQAKPFSLERDSSQITIEREHLTIRLPGDFNVANFLAAYTLARHWGVSLTTIAAAADSLRTIPGRVEDVSKELPGTPFSVIVDYAHTPDSLENVYKAFPNQRKICVLSGTGGGRDTWKRPVMGGIADTYCAEIILTDEDPYDDDPKEIVKDIAKGIAKKEYTVEMNRRLAIRESIQRAKPGDVILITGKGTDPYIMGPRGTKIPWSDHDVALEELELVKHRS
ncbi:MAG: UDP-N-acetylmuramyl-tripeptide synthetase [Patescibacteria group bacterium]